MNKVAGRIAAHRKGKVEGKVAIEYIVTVVESELLLLSCMIEGATESQKLLRPMDDEAFDCCEQPFLLDLFLKTIDRLFSPHDASCWQVGLVKHMLTLLASGMVVTDGATTRLLGGPSMDVAAAKEECRYVMYEWCVVARLVVRAEFPSFEITVRFSFFSLSSRHRKTLNEKELEFSLECLAKFFGYQSAAVVGSFFSLIGLALAVFAANPGWHHVECWVLVFSKRSRAFFRSHLHFARILQR